MVEKIAATGLKIKLDTNGSNDEVLGWLVSLGFLDYIAVDIKISFPKYYLISSNGNVSDTVKERIKVCMGCGVPYEFHISCALGVLEKEDIIKIGEVAKDFRKYCF